MLTTMPSPMFSFDFSSPFRPSKSSPLSSSPMRASQSSSPPAPLSPRNLNTLPRRDIQSSPISAPKFKHAKSNPLKQSRQSAQEGRRKLFLNNVRQRRDDKQWERRGGDQEALKLEWAALDRRWKQQKATDIDGLVFEDELDDIPLVSNERMPHRADEMEVDMMEQEEAAELAAMVSNYEGHPPGSKPRPESLSLSDDEDYDSLFMDILSLQQSSQDDIVLSGEMDIS